MNKRILLFDIDGTLTTSVKHVDRDVFQQTLSEIYDVRIEKKGVVYSGGTGTQISVAIEIIYYKYFKIYLKIILNFNINNLYVGTGVFYQNSMFSKIVEILDQL